MCVCAYVCYAMYKYIYEFMNELMYEGIYYYSFVTFLLSQKLKKKSFPNNWPRSRLITH